MKTPMLVISGRHDRGITVRYPEELTKLVPGAKLEISESGGHFPFVEDTEWFVKTLLGFVRSRV
ncbi:MAG: alpha/beta hydrolase [Dehalococcoidia bacterium]|nr:alpha/beta hydrolase [Dehalococcoidia bacterium]